MGVVSSITLTGCFHTKEYKETKVEAKEIAIEYIKDKYDEKLRVGEIKADSEIGSGLPTPPSGTVQVYSKNKKYSVYANTKTGDETFLDVNKNYKVEEYKEKFQLLLNDMKSDFRGYESSLEFYLYKSDKYMNEEVKKAKEEMKNGDKSPSNSDTYEFDYIYMKALSSAKTEYDEETEKLKIYPWEDSIIY